MMSLRTIAPPLFGVILFGAGCPKQRPGPTIAQSEPGRVMKWSEVEDVARRNASLQIYPLDQKRLRGSIGRYAPSELVLVAVPFDGVCPKYNYAGLNRYWVDGGPLGCDGYEPGNERCASAVKGCFPDQLCRSYCGELCPEPACATRCWEPFEHCVHSRNKAIRSRCKTAYEQCLDRCPKEPCVKEPLP